MDNPYWDAVKDRVTPSDFSWDDTLQIERWRLKDDRTPVEVTLNRTEFVERYSWSVPDPHAIAFVVAQCGGEGLVDPMAGTGYWAYVLGQLGVDVVCYDLDPGAENHWHPHDDLWVEVEKMPCDQSVQKHSDRVLFLSWPPYNSPDGEDAIRHYGGHKIILLGEVGGCTGSEGMFERLASEWVQVAAHSLIQWWGMHDGITVYERDAPPSW